MKAAKWQEIFERMSFKEADLIIEERWEEIEAVYCGDVDSLTGDQRMLWQILNGAPRANGFGLSPIELYLREKIKASYDEGKSSARRYHTKKYQRAKAEMENYITQLNEEQQRLQNKYEELENQAREQADLEDENTGNEKSDKFNADFLTFYHKHHYKACQADIAKLVERLEEIGHPIPLDQLDSFKLAIRKKEAHKTFLQNAELDEFRRSLK